MLFNLLIAPPQQPASQIQVLSACKFRVKARPQFKNSIYVAIYLNLALSRKGNPCYHLHKSGFACAVVAYKGYCFSFVNFKRNIVDSLFLFVFALSEKNGFHSFFVAFVESVDLCNILHFYNRFTHCRPPTEHPVFLFSVSCKATAQSLRIQTVQTGSTAAVSTVQKTIYALQNSFCSPRLYRLRD